ncbi:hypothetical protein AJ78_01867 [Emergomyces pasteurianus Ep9510]|uniref:Uncharacterized protein n=1 Tax=Emergomyces pasteurianus Ep9510 TaxID=1447872 RepID=A0A1J9QPK4_9EURO|nr:hypothetical protein AJ78_01867 [Emergomyces pasteurianus Ep9510]
MQACLRPGRARYLGPKLRLVPSSTIIPSSKLTGFCSRNLGPPPSINSAATLLVRSWNPGRPIPGPHDEKTNPSRWISELERYLPSELCENTKVDYYLGKRPESEKCLAILDLLDHARSPDSLGCDLLAYLGVKLGRWSAVHAIVNRLLDNAEEAEKRLSSLRKGSLPSNLDWVSLGCFDTMTGDECSKLQAPGILKSEDQVSLNSIDLYNDGPRVTSRMGEKFTRIGTMEELWPALGSIVLEAADLPPEELRTAMFYFYRIVARLHHLDYIPHGVYKYSKSQDSERLNRGTPAMHLLSSHIMNVLSDAVWVGNEIDTAAFALATGKHVSAATKYKIQVRPLGPEIWLEFILWCCVEGGFNIEGSWILKQLATRKSRWFVESFASHSINLDSVTSSKIDRYDTWTSCACGSKSANVNESHGPFVGLGRRTISSEVVTSMMDGLNNCVKVGVGHRGVYHTSILDYMKSLVQLLKENDIFLKPRDVDHLIVRMMEARGVVPEVDPKSFEHLLKLASNIPNPLPEESLEANAHPHPLDRSGVVLGLNHYILDAYANTGHVYRSRRVLERLNTVKHTEKADIEHRFLKEFTGSPAMAQLDDTATVQEVPQAISSIPGPNANTASLTGFSSSSLSRLLDFSISPGAHDIARHLLFTDGDERATVPRECYSDDLLAPAIIRYATAIKDEKLLSTVAEDLPLPWSIPVIKAFFGYAIQCHDWDRINEILLHLQNTQWTKGNSWGSEEVAYLAAAIIRLDEQSSTGVLKPNPLTKSGEILTKLLQGEFNPTPNYSEGDTKYYEAMLFQFLRIFKSIRGTISDICQKVNPQWTAKQAPAVNIPSSAFNKILSAIVETRGSEAGKRLYHLWCIDRPSTNTKLGGNVKLRSTARTPERLRGIGHQVVDLQLEPGQYSKFVQPSLQTVRIIARAMVRELHASRTSGGDPVHGSKQDIFGWARKHFALFQLNREDVADELRNYWIEVGREREPKGEDDTSSSSGGSLEKPEITKLTKSTVTKD